jgi:hypothetical protein
MLLLAFITGLWRISILKVSICSFEKIVSCPTISILSEAFPAGTFEVGSFPVLLLQAQIKNINVISRIK